MEKRMKAEEKLARRAERKANGPSVTTDEYGNELDEFGKIIPPEEPYVNPDRL